MGFGKGGSDTTTTVQSNEPPAYVKPYLENALAQASSLYNNTPLYRRPWTADDQLAYSGIYGQAQGYSPSQGAISNIQDTMGLGTPTVGAAQDYLQGRLGMTPEQQQAEITQASQPFVDQLLPQVNMQSSLAGRTGSGMAANMFGEGVGRIAAQQQAQLANQQLGAAGMAGQLDALPHQIAQGYGSVAPALEQSRFVPGQQMAGLADYVEQVNRGRIEEPWQRFERYMGSFGVPAGLAGGTAMSTQSVPRQGANPFGMLLGAGSMLGGLGWMPFG